MDEFSYLSHNAEQAGVTGVLPAVARIETGPISALRWGTESPRVVFLHGGGQNAHTWDTVVLGLGLPALAIDHREVWNRLYRYTLEDMPPERAFGRLKEFTFYFAKNFFFGHEMFKGIQKARNPEEIRAAADAFLAAGPQLSSSRGLPFS